MSKKRTVGTKNLVLPRFWIREQLEDHANEYWTLLGRSLRQSDLCVENTREWALCQVDTDDHYILNSFDLENFTTHPISGDIVVHFANAGVEQSEYASYHSDSFSYECPYWVAFVMVPCSPSEISIIQSLGCEDVDLFWTDIFPRWLEIKDYRVIATVDPVPIADNLHFKEPCQYEPAEQPLEFSEKMNYVVLKVDIKNNTEELIDFSALQWRQIVPGVDNIECSLPNAKYVPCLKAYMIGKSHVWYVVLRYTNQPFRPTKHFTANTRPYVSWQMLNASTLNLIAFANQSEQSISLSKSAKLVAIQPTAKQALITHQLPSTPLLVDTQLPAVKQPQTDSQLLTTTTQPVTTQPPARPPIATQLPPTSPATTQPPTTQQVTIQSPVQILRRGQNMTNQESGRSFICFQRITQTRHQKKKI